jgi:hypothetical protein
VNKREDVENVEMLKIEKCLELLHVNKREDVENVEMLKIVR